MKYSLIIPVLMLALFSPLRAWQEEVTTRNPDPAFLTIRPVHLSFQMNWNGKINSGRLNMLFGREDARYPKHFIAQIYGASTGLARTLYPYDYSFTSFLRKDSYLPAMFTSTETTSKKRTETSNWYRPSVRSREVSTPLRKGKAPKTKTSSFSFERAPIHDLASALIYLRRLELKIGETAVLVVHPFASPYLARVKVLRRETHRGLKCLRMDLRLQKIGPGGKLIGYDKMKRATLWLSDDQERLPVELRTEVFIGDVRAILTGKKYL